jgi:hypothetical protein
MNINLSKEELGLLIDLLEGEIEVLEDDCDEDDVDSEEVQDLVAMKALRERLFEVAI